jgi:hypothetical protein
MRKQQAGSACSDFLQTILKAHEEARDRHPNGKEGFNAFQRIVTILGPDWDWTYEPGHWLKFRLSRAHEPGYSWISHFARELEVVARIPGAHQVISRLDNMPSYPGAWGEFDAALKLSLSGFECKFVQTNSQPTPDLFASREGRTLEVEVTSTNPSPKKGLALSGFHAVEWTAFTHRCVARGLFSRVPKREEIELVERRVLQACEEARQKNGVVKVNIRGLMTYFVAPLDRVDEIPESWRQTIVMRGIRKVSKTERLAGIIGNKCGPQLSRAKSALLLIYDLDTLRGLGSERERPEDYDDSEIQLALGGFANVAGAILIQPFVSVLDLEPKNVVTKWRRLIEHSLPDFEAERCTIWSNPMSDDPAVLDTIVDCIVNFPSTIQSAF